MATNRQHPFNIDIHSFHHLFREQYPALRAYAALLTGDQLAEDIVQDVFLNTWENRNSITFHTSVKAYLFRSVYNRSLNQLRHLKIVRNNEQQIEHGLTEQEMHLADPDKNHIIQKLYMKEMRSELDQAIDSLPEKCREVFKLSYIDTLKNKEISQQLGISVSTVEKHINHALKTLRKTLQQLRILIMNFLLY